MKIVLDTNVLVSGLLSPYQAPGKIVRMVSSGLLSVCYDGRILSEYQEVLARPKFHFPSAQIKVIMEQIRGDGKLISAPPLKGKLPDAQDEMFLEVAIAGRVRCLVTGNLKDYPVSLRQGVDVVSPSQMLEIYRGENHEKKEDVMF